MLHIQSHKKKKVQYFFVLTGSAKDPSTHVSHYPSLYYHHHHHCIFLPKPIELLLAGTIYAEEYLLSDQLREVCTRVNTTCNNSSFCFTLARFYNYFERLMIACYYSSGLVLVVSIVSQGALCKHLFRCIIIINTYIFFGVYNTEKR